MSQVERINPTQQQARDFYDILLKEEGIVPSAVTPDGSISLTKLVKNKAGLAGHGKGTEEITVSPAVLNELDQIVFSRIEPQNIPSDSPMEKAYYVFRSIQKFARRHRLKLVR